MSYIHKTRNSIQKAVNLSKVLFATILTLAFGATMVWGAKGLFQEKSNGAFAIDYSVNFLSKDYTALQTFMSTESTTQTCHSVGDQWNECCGSCTSQKITCTAVAYDAASGCDVCWAWSKGDCNQFDKACGDNCESERPTPATTITFFCETLDHLGKCETGAIAVKEHGVFCGDPLPLPEICYAKQSDDFLKDAPGCGVADWGTFISPARISEGDPNHPSCHPQEPATCEYISGPEGTVLPGQSLNYTGTINTGDPELLQWFLDGSSIPSANSLNYSTTAPTTGTHTYKLSVNGDNVAACAKTITVQKPEPSFSCDAKRSNTPTTTVLKQGDILTYYIDYSLANLEEHLVIVDTLPEGLSIINLENITGGTNCGVGSSYGENFTTLTCQTTQSGTLTFQAKVNDGFTGGSVTNTAYVVYQNNVDQKEECNSITHIMAKPEVSCTNKTSDKTQVEIGDTVNYTISTLIENVEVDELIIVDDFDETKILIDPMNVMISPSEELMYDCEIEDRNGNQVLKCSVRYFEGEGILETGVHTFTYPATVLDSLVNTNISNTVITTNVIKDGITYSDANPSDSCQTTINLVVPEPNVECVSKTVLPTTDVKVGDVVKYTINYSSINQRQSINVSDNLDISKFEFVDYEGSASNFCEPVLNGEVRCQVPENEEGSISFFVKVIQSGNLINDAAVSDHNQNDDLCQVPLEVRELEQDLSCISKVANETHRDIGEQLNFTITYKNTGETTLEGFRLVDQLPIGMDFISSKDNACDVMAGYVGNGPMIECLSEEILEPEDESTFEITVTINSNSPIGSTITNSITHLSSGEIEGDVENCSEDVYINLPKPIVKIEKVTKNPADRTMILGDDAETMEDHVKFRITVTNVGPTKLVVVPLKDSFNSNDYKFISATPAESTVATFNSRTIVYWENLGELEVGESKEIIITLEALETYWDDLDENVLPNTVRVEDVIDENGVEANEDEDSDHVVILGSILGKELEFSINKVLLTENPTEEGKQVRFNIRITNTGEKDIEEIKFMDTYDISYLKYTDFSEDISHKQDLYSVDTVNGLFVHDNLLYEKDSLEPNEYVEFEMWFIAENKKGETTNWAKAIVEDKERNDSAKVRIVVEELAKTGSNIMIPLAIGIALTLGISGKVILRRKKK